MMRNKWPYSPRGETGQMMMTMQNKFVIFFYFKLGSHDLNRRKGNINQSDTLHIHIKSIEFSPFDILTKLECELGFPCKFISPTYRKTTHQLAIGIELI